MKAIEIIAVSDPAGSKPRLILGLILTLAGMTVMSYMLWVIYGLLNATADLPLLTKMLVPAKQIALTGSASGVSSGNITLPPELFASAGYGIILGFFFIASVIAGAFLRAGVSLLKPEIQRIANKSQSSNI